MDTDSHRWVLLVARAGRGWHGEAEVAYAMRLRLLKHDAHDKLRIGTKKDAVIRFFAESGIPVTFIGDEAYGTISTMGCAPAGCGSDDAFLGLRVKVDGNGTVVAAGAR